MASACASSDAPDTTPFGLGTARGSGTDSGSAEADGGSEPEPFDSEATLTWGDASTTSGWDGTTSASAVMDAESSDSGESSSGDEGEAELPCDSGFLFDPDVPTTDTFYVITSHENPLAYVDLTVVGPNTATATYVAVVASDPWQWRWRVTGHVAGVYTFSFGNADSEGGPVTVHATCQREVID